MFNFHYGKQVVGVTRDAGNPHIRAWAAKDSSGNLTMFLANTAVGSATDTAQIAIQGATSVGTSGERWTMLSSGSGAWQPQRTAISINGAVSPAASSIKTMAGQAITTGASFKVGLPPYSMTWLKIPLSGVAAQPERKAFVPSAQEAPVIKSMGPREFSIALTGANVTDETWNVNVYSIAGEKVGDWAGLTGHATVRMPGAAAGIYFFVVKKGRETFTNAVMAR
jgi:hypothetical protein